MAGIRPGQAKGPWVGVSHPPIPPDLDEKVRVTATDTTTDYLLNKVAVAGGLTAVSIDTGGGDQALLISGAGVAGDHKSAVTGADTTADYLSSKITTFANSGILLTVLNPGANEQLQVEVDGSLFDDAQVAITGADMTVGFLATKLVAGSNVTLTVVNPGLSETLRVDATGDHRVLTEAADALAEYLVDKITVTGGLTATTVNKGGGIEAVQLSGAGVAGDHKVLAAPTDIAAETLVEKITTSGNITAVTYDKGGGDLGLRLTVPVDQDIKVKVEAADTTTEYLLDKLAVAGGLSLASIDKGGGNLAAQLSGAGVAGDHKVLAAPTDITAETLVEKITTSGNITAVTYDKGGGDLGLRLTVPADQDIKVKVTAADTTTEYLLDKLAIAGGLSLASIDKGGGNLAAQLSGAGVTGDHKVLTEAADALAEYLVNKIVVAGGLTAATIDKGGGVEAVQISGASIPDVKVKATATDITAEYLLDKLAVAGSLTLASFDKGGGVQAVRITDTDLPQVKVTATDTTAEYLLSKLAVTGGLSLSSIDKGAGVQAAQLSGAGVTGDHKVMASSTDTTPGYLDETPSGGKITVEGSALEYHEAGGNEQINIYPIPGLADDFAFSRPFWQGTQALTSGDWAVDTANSWVQCNAANNATDWIRAAIDGDFDYFFRFTINGATTVGFQVDGNGNTITLKWSANVITRTMTGQANQTVAFTPAAGNVMLRIRRQGNYYRFFYRELTTSRWIEFLVADFAINLGMDTVLRLSTTGSVNARIREISLWDSRMPQAMNGVRAKMVPLTEAATITPNATNGMMNTVTLTASRIMGAPTNWSVPDGAMFVLRIRQDGTGGRTISSWNAIYRFPSGATPTLSTGANKTDYFGFIYNATDSKFDCIAQEFNL